MSTYSIDFHVYADDTQLYYPYSRNRLLKAGDVKENMKLDDLVLADI